MVERKFYERRIKPVVDRLFALALLFILSPILVLMLFVLFVSFSGKPFFIQKRVGKNEKMFWMLKFRSMIDETAERTTDKDRLTKIGRFIRKTSIDELPQLVNVLKGDMSLVGPRPLLVEYLSSYNEEEKTRHLVKPGITGLAQVGGRNTIDWGERLKLDVLYVNRISFLLDIRILLKTSFEVLRLGKSTYKDDKVITFTEYASNR